MDIKLLQDRVQGLTQRIGQLRASEAIMLQAQGFDRQIVKARKEIATIGADIQAAKEELGELQVKQAEIISAAAESFCSRITEALPHGQAVLEIQSDHVLLGWSIDGGVRPFKSLSGGERVSCELALARALGADTLIKEVAELDHENLAGILDKLGALDVQAILVTCHAPPEVPKSWTVVMP